MSPSSTAQKVRPKTNTTPILFALNKWSPTAALLLGYAQTLIRLERVNDARAWEVAEALEIATRSSLALCMKDIHALHDGDPPSTEEEQDAFERLHAIASGLLALSYYVRKIKRRLEGRAVARRITERVVARQRSNEVRCYPSPMYKIPVLDPGWRTHPERRRRMRINALDPSTSLRMSATEIARRASDEHCLVKSS